MSHPSCSLLGATCFLHVNRLTGASWQVLLLLLSPLFHLANWFSGASSEARLWSNFKASSELAAIDFMKWWSGAVRYHVMVCDHQLVVSKKTYLDHEVCVDKLM